MFIKGMTAEVGVAAHLVPHELITAFLLTSIWQHGSIAKEMSEHHSKSATLQPLRCALSYVLCWKASSKLKKCPTYRKSFASILKVFVVCNGHLLGKDKEHNHQSPAIDYIPGGEENTLVPSPEVKTTICTCKVETKPFLCHRGMSHGYPT